MERRISPISTGQHFAIWVDETRPSVVAPELGDDSIWDIWGGLIWSDSTDLLQEERLTEYENGVWYLAAGQRQYVKPLSIRNSPIFDKPFSRTHSSRSPCFPQRPGLLTNCQQIEFVFEGDVGFELAARYRRLLRRRYRTRFFPVESPDGWFGVIKFRRSWRFSLHWRLVAYSPSRGPSPRVSTVRIPNYDPEQCDRTLGEITWIGQQEGIFCESATGEVCNQRGHQP